MSKIPAVDSVWQRKDNHNKYTVMTVANRGMSSNQKQYPVTVVFMGKGKTRALPIDAFLSIMEEVKNV